MDREDPKRTFEKALLSIPRDGCLVRTWYGVGGQGKTALARELFRMSSEEVDPSYAHLRRAMVDLHARPVTDPDHLLVWIRNAFCRSGVKFPAFDLAFAIMWEKTRGEEPLPKFENAWLFRTGEGFAEAVPDAVTLTRELVADTTQTIPLLGPLLKKGSQWAFDRGKRAWLEKTRSQLKHLYRDGQMIESYEMSDLMPWMLAQDLNYHLEQNPEHRFVLFVDEYERVMDKGGTGARWRENHFDAHMRKLVSETDGLLAIFFSRERLPWGEEEAWRNDLEDNQYLLGGLSDDDAEDWLQQVPIEDPVIRKAIISGSRETDAATSPIFPLMLDLQIEHWKNLGERAQPENFAVAGRGFEARRQELVQRLLRDYDDPIQELVTRLALAQQFDRAAFAHIVKTFNIPISLAAFDRLADLSIMTVGEDGWLSPHRAIADAIVQSEKDEIISTSREALIENFEARAQPNRVLDVTEDTFKCLVEAARLRRQIGLEGYVEWLNTVQGTAFKAHRPQFFEGLWRQALIMTQTLLGERHPDVIASYNNLATCLQAQGRIGEAEPLYRKGLEISQATLGETHPDVGTAYNNLATCLKAQGRAKEAEPLYRKGLEISHEILGEAHPNVGTGYNNLASCVRAQGHAREAEPLYRKGLEIRKTALGEAHPDVGESYDNLAGCLQAQGHAGAAEPLFQKALEIRKTALSEAHPDVGISYNNLAHCLQAQNRAKEAEPLYRKALKIRQKALGEVHPDVGISYNNLAGCLQAQGHAEAAEPLLRNGLKIFQATLGETHPYVGNSYNNLGGCLQVQGRTHDAEPLYRKGLEIRLETLGEAHPAVGDSYNNLAYCLHAQGRAEDAEPLYRKSLEISQPALGEAHPDVLESYDNMACCLQAQGREKDAEPFYLQILKIRLETLGEAHPAVGISYNNLAGCLQAQGHAKVAESLYLKGLEIFQAVLDETHPIIEKCYDNLAYCFEAQGRHDEAYAIWQHIKSQQEPTTN
ncbi:tetratricopeptide repeat protein [Donghicola eburneus]|uniref:tetratricopeptide repeat protein n=1 Tax=Donghicola eburneus TaxID=393278 RepID=UPI0015A6EA6D|nr:tetratricopeptide repeat protein [Donghicola eburneus]